MTVERQRGVYIPTGPNKRHEPMVGPGISVWAIIGYLQLYDWDVSRVQRAYNPDLTEEDVRAAWDYYKEHPEEIDAKLEANARMDFDYSEWGIV